MSSGCTICTAGLGKFLFSTGLATDVFFGAFESLQCSGVIDEQKLRSLFRSQFLSFIFVGCNGAYANSLLPFSDRLIITSVLLQRNLSQF